MLITVLVLSLACAIVAENDTNIDDKVLKSLADLIDENKSLDASDIARLYRAAQALGLDRELVNKLSQGLNGSERVIHKDAGYNIYADSEKGPLGESPDYASSVVLASDLLALTSAVGNVGDKLCREQGYRFLDGLLSNKRWALKSKYLLLTISFEIINGTCRCVDFKV
ncbi:unnamed protein product [Pieris macdunnoughi]|uniref:Ribophorin-2 n=1 Tax=Pieris macdunnoughi TaxID=345717 RepID=A0A821UTX6_9NEOP|nr:unnamed protein product [Pieris macdunnoughi]